MKENYKLLQDYMELSNKFYSLTVTPWDIQLQGYFDQHLIEKLINMGFSITDEDSKFIRYCIFEKKTHVKISIEKN